MLVDALANRRLHLFHGDDLSAIDLKDRRPDEQPSPTAGATASAASPVVADVSAHVRIFEDFIRAVSSHTAPCCDGRSARESVALIEAVYRSARIGSPVDLA